MADVTLARNAGHWGQFLVWESLLTVAEGQTTATATSTQDYNGLVWMVTIDPGTLTASATLKGYETGHALTTPPYFLSYTVPNPAIEKVIYPLVQRTDNSGTAITGIYDAYPVAGKLKLDLASATAADSVTVRVYIMG